MTPTLRHRPPRPSAAAAEDYGLPPVVGVEQAAAFAQRSARTIRGWIAAGTLPAARPIAAGSGRILIRRHDLLRVLGLDR